MDTDNILLWLIKKFGSGFGLLAASSCFGFGTFPSQQGHEAFAIGLCFMWGVWLYERFLH